MKKIGICLRNLLFSSLLLVVTLSAEENLLPNGNFEEAGIDEAPASWSIQPKGGVAKLDSSVKYGGENSLRLELSEGEGEARNILVNSKSFPVKPDKLYLITLWYKAEGFGGENKYQGASACGKIIINLGKDNKTLVEETMGFPYCDIVDWAIFISLLTNLTEK